MQPSETIKKDIASNKNFSDAEKQELTELVNSHRKEINSFHDSIYPEGLLSAIEQITDMSRYERLCTLFFTLYPNH